MTNAINSIPQEDNQKQQARKKENNPFSEQEKHGEDAQRRAPEGGLEYQGNPSVQRRAPGIEDDTREDPERRECSQT
jgi:hypothetical protein